jgi:hypothetical protein
LLIEFQVLDEKSSRAIMALALEQQQEEADEDDSTEAPVKQSRVVRIVEEDEGSESEDENAWEDEEFDAELVSKSAVFISCELCSFHPAGD